jgi:hypothetical protein
MRLYTYEQDGKARNYRSHIEEEPGAQVLEDPRFFAKMPSVVS